ncbi:MAG TPA: hypothetical protein PK546_10920 [Chitinophagales bacterium]|nr:hypothetical protein [Chitinophagales bacterium]
MNKTILTIILAFTMLMTNATSSLLSSNSKTSIYSGNVINIKLKNDTDEAFSVINAGSGGTYRSADFASGNKPGGDGLAVAVGALCRMVRSAWVGDNRVRATGV